MIPSNTNYKLYSEKGFPEEAEIHPTAILHGTWIDCSAKVTIEKNVEISRNVNIFTHNHQFDKPNWHKLPIKTRPLRICEGAFIGINVTILWNVERIGKYSVIGAGSVLTKSVGDYEIWAGNPAKKIGDVEK